MTKDKGSILLPIEHIAPSILILCGQRVLLDNDLAALYGVETRRLNEQVRRNRSRFPAASIFELLDDEVANLKSQFATSSCAVCASDHLVFTEHGARVAATVLNGPQAVEMTIHVVRALLQLRDLLAQRNLMGLGREQDPSTYAF